MNIYLLRHGIAAALSQENNFRDEQRALTVEGIAKMREAAQGGGSLACTHNKAPFLTGRETLASPKTR